MIPKTTRQHAYDNASEKIAKEYYRVTVDLLKELQRRRKEDKT